MKMDSNDRDYSNGEITVHWRPSKCIHATTCYRELIEVFNPRNRPWVNMNGASTDDIIRIVRKCPTDALTYDWNDPSKKSEKPGIKRDAGLKKEQENQYNREPVKIKIMKDGPILVEGDFRITGPEGNELQSIFMTSFCRCGQSGNMPFCDGSHRLSGFKDN